MSLSNKLRALTEAKREEDGLQIHLQQMKTVERVAPLVEAAFDHLTQYLEYNARRGAESVSINLHDFLHNTTGPYRSLTLEEGKVLFRLTIDALRKADATLSISTSDITANISWGRPLSVL